jgi:HTH-type transcriptional regulator/antitoxin HigA
VKRGWIRETTDTESLEKELANFFEVKTLADAPNIQFAARMSVSYGEFSPSHWVWLFRAKKLARAVHAAPFRPEAFRAGLTQLHKYVASEHDTRRVPKLLADLGVRLVILEHLPKTRIDGAALWVDDKTPAVALSMRFDRIDAFWYTLSHELAHILHGDRFSLDDNLVGEDAKPITDKPDFEQRADREAAEFLISRKDIEGFVLRVAPLFSRTKIIRFANRIRVHPGVIVGQLQRRSAIHYSQFRDTLVKVRAALTEAALTDGWGAAPPLK